jgi:hypothetical protein|tara:strand:- start:69 stop:353 length:285 start_codon:yes stop_codon:yes gene_type:complete
MKFKDIKFKEMEELYESEDCPNPVRAQVKFGNGLEASIVKNRMSCGGEKGLYEIGVYWGKRMIHIDRWGNQTKGDLKPEDVEHELAYLENYFED